MNTTDARRERNTAAAATEVAAGSLKCCRSSTRSRLSCPVRRAAQDEFRHALIDNVDTMIQPTPHKIVYYFGEYQPLFDRYTRVDLRHGMPKASEIETLTDALVVFDDMMTEVDDRHDERFRAELFQQERAHEDDQSERAVYRPV